MLFSTALSLVLLLNSQTSAAEQPSPPESSEATKAQEVVEATEASEESEAVEAADSDKPKCKSVFEVGSRIPTRVCRSAADWERIEQENRQAVDDNMRNRGSTGDPGTR